MNKCEFLKEISKKSSVNIRKNNIPKPMTSRKNEKNSSMVILTTTSNTKPHHIRKNVSVTKKINIFFNCVNF